MDSFSLCITVHAMWSQSLSDPIVDCAMDDGTEDSDDRVGMVDGVIVIQWVIVSLCTKCSAMMQGEKDAGFLNVCFREFTRVSIK